MPRSAVICNKPSHGDALVLLADEAAGAARRVYSDRAAFLVSSILADRESRSLTFGLENPLATRFWTAVKTGTSKEMRDNWCVGYSRRYTVGVWVGNFGGEPMRNVSGVTGAAPVWTEVMAWLHGTVPSAPPPAPAGVVAAPVAFPGAVEPARLEWFLAGTEPPSAAPAIAGGHPRIIAPVSGTIIASTPTSRRAGSASSSRRRTRASRCDGCSTATIWAPRASYMSGTPSAAGTDWS